MMGSIAAAGAPLTIVHASLTRQARLDSSSDGNGMSSKLDRGSLTDMNSFSGRG